MASSYMLKLLRRTRAPFCSNWTRAMSCVPEVARPDAVQTSKTLIRNKIDLSPPPPFEFDPSPSSLRPILSSEPRPILTDTFGRKHSYLRISLTERCNLRCQYCMPEEGVSLTPTDDLLTSAEIVKIAGLFVDAGVDKIRFTGGEPTVRADILNIMAEVNTLRTRGLKTIGMTTNGIVLAKRMADYKAAGLNSVNISLDTLDPNLFQIITRRNGHDKVLASIEAALNMMPPGTVKVNCVVMRGVNDQELVDFVRWTEKKDVEVRFIEFMPFDGNKFSRQKFFSFMEMKERIRAALPLEVMPPGHSDVAKVYHVPGFLGRVGFISSMSEHFCDTCNRLRITADGNLKVCLFGPTEVSLRDILRQNQTDDQIREVIGMAVSRKKSQARRHG